MCRRLSVAGGVIGLLALAALRAAAQSRADSPHVTRCDLNGQPRMAVFKAHPEMWVAFDTLECRMALAWKGGVTPSGRLTDGREGVTTTSKEDRLYYEQGGNQVWTALVNKQMIYLTVRFRGYTFFEKNVIFHFSLLMPGGEEIKSKNTVTAFETNNGELLLQQRFDFEGIPEKTRIVFPLMGGLPWDRFESWKMGSGDVDLNSFELVQKRDGYTITGIAWFK